ncbi:thiamine-phosphate pyrophosphorylase [uncultured Ilyobacter sp.]|uniref:thiamine-phosphate pyrophosphorylase n=1 Tax=uncultured Ilyobacter sp. TaxID=544433 RepID=UPI0029C0DD05|nr:thiamine-phosphate pyrophosphorylase [uncultured Ilyobacter sp.]
MQKLYRILDVNVNRASEGIRVVEDLFRFYFENEVLTKECRIIRHSLRKTMKEIDKLLIESRDAKGDIGLSVSQKIKNDSKESVDQLLISNFKRIQEAVRCIEEVLKVLGHYNLSKDMENVRYQSYSLEKDISVYLKTSGT